MRSLGAFAVVVSLALPAMAASEHPTLTYDLGVSTGRYGGHTYYEANLGLNYFAEDWLAWRNAIFGRIDDPSRNVYGLDTSLRAIADIGDARTGLTAFVGPGFRFANGVSSAPFAEEGLVIHLGGLSIGGGAKQVFNSLTHTGEADDMQYFVILGGGGSL